MIERGSDVVSVDEAARRLGVNRNTLTRAIRNGDFPGYKLGSRYVIGKPLFQKVLDGEWKAERKNT